MRLHPESLRIRLALWYCGVLSLVLLFFGVCLYLVVRAQLLRHHDAELVGTAQAVEDVLSEHADCDNLTPEQVGKLDRHSRLVLFHAVDGDTRSFYRSPDLGSQPLLRGLTETPDFLNERATFKTYGDGRGFLRAYTRPYRSRAGRRGVIRVMERLGDVRGPLTNLRLALLVLAPFAVGVSSLGGYWLAGRALAPVDEITRLAREIEASQLSRRLPAAPTHDEIGRLVETFNQMIARLEAAFEGMKRFTADASHELRGPLTNMHGTVDVALSLPRSPGEYQCALSSVREDAERLARIVEDLLVLARADARRLMLEHEPVRLDILVREVAASFCERASEAGVIIEADASEAVVVDGDERWLRQLLYNLVENALKFTAAAPQKGRPAEVRLGIVSSGDDARLEVRDSGPGIPEDDLDRIFERFYRVDGARTHGPAGGSGLGLSIAAWVVHAHAGSIKARTLPEGGAEFVVTLPRGGTRGGEPPGFSFSKRS